MPPDNRKLRRDVYEERSHRDPAEAEVGGRNENDHGYRWTEFARPVTSWNGALETRTAMESRSTTSRAFALVAPGGGGTAAGTRTTA